MYISWAFEKMMRPMRVKQVWKCVHQVREPQKLNSGGREVPWKPRGYKTCYKSVHGQMHVSVKLLSSDCRNDRIAQLCNQCPVAASGHRFQGGQLKTILHASSCWLHRSPHLRATKAKGWRYTLQRRAVMNNAIGTRAAAHIKKQLSKPGGWETRHGQLHQKRAEEALRKTTLDLEKGS